MNSLIELWHSTGLYQIHWDQAAMIVIGLLLLYLAIVRGFEPLLLVPIGFGGVLANIPGVDIAVGDGILYQLYSMG
ncbi:MAG: sodium ion-translocating decarboxylase subunit beta, partial [Pseudomonadales bacterium]